MNVLEETRNSTFKRTRKNNEILVTERSKQLFKVVVNNYKQLEEKVEPFKEDTEDVAGQKGLPPQPQGYLKFPDYDWF